MNNCPTTTHATWCDPARCTTDHRTFVEHRSTPDRLKNLDVEITVSRSALFTADGQLEYDLAYLVVDMIGVDTVGEVFLNALELRQLAAMFLRHADALDQDGGLS